METYFKPIEYYRNKFYQKENRFENFMKLSEEQLSALAKKIYKNQEATIDNQCHLLVKTSKLKRYYNTLEYLTNPYIHLELKTFDERMAYLIMTIDPNLVIFKEFLKMNLISLADIAKIEDEKERINLLKRRNQVILSFESLVREEIGFYDIKILKYEEMFFLKFFGEKELITEVENDYHDSLMIKAKLLRDFNSISDDRYNELSDIAQIWLSLIQDKFNSKVAVYSIIKQKELLGLTSFAEQLALFIMIIDSDLDMLRIYEEESRMQIIKERIIEEFGYFNKELFVLERKFYERFYSDKDLSFWSRIKK